MSEQIFFHSYAALGLQFALTPTQSGGAERTLISSKGSASAGSVTATLESGGAKLSTIPRGFGRIIRDEFGNVVRIDLPEAEETQDREENTELPEANVDDKTMDDWVGCLNKIHETGDERGLCSSSAQGTQPIAGE
jgi:nucleolar protein 16